MPGDLQRETVSGPDTPPHPLHVAEEHNDAEEGEVAGDTHEGAGHGEIVQQIPGAERRDRDVSGTDGTAWISLSPPTHIHVCSGRHLPRPPPPPACCPHLGLPEFKAQPQKFPPESLPLLLSHWFRASDPFGSCQCSWFLGWLSQRPWVGGRKHSRESAGLAPGQLGFLSWHSIGSPEPRQGVAPGLRVRSKFWG